MTEYVHVGSHADLLATGYPIGPGDRISSDLLQDEDRHIVDEGRLVDVASFDGGPENEALIGDELKAKASQLDIKGRSSMSADQLRTAIAAHESGEVADAA